MLNIQEHWNPLEMTRPIVNIKRHWYCIFIAFFSFVRFVVGQSINERGEVTYLGRVCFFEDVLKFVHFFIIFPQFEVLFKFICQMKGKMR